MALKHSRYGHKTLKEVQASRQLQAAQAKFVMRQLEDKYSREKSQTSNPQSRSHLYNTEAQTKVGSLSAVTLRSCSGVARWDALSTGAPPSAFFLT